VTHDQRKHLHASLGWGEAPLVVQRGFVM